DGHVPHGRFRAVPRPPPLYGGPGHRAAAAIRAVLSPSRSGRVATGPFGRFRTSRPVAGGRSSDAERPERLVATREETGAGVVSPGAGRPSLGGPRREGRGRIAAWRPARRPVRPSSHPERAGPP